MFIYANDINTIKEIEKLGCKEIKNTFSGIKTFEISKDKLEVLKKKGIFNFKLDNVLTF